MFSIIFFADLMMNDKSLSMTGNTTIPDDISGRILPYCNWNSLGPFNGVFSNVSTTKIPAAFQDCKDIQIFMPH